MIEFIEELIANTVFITILSGTLVYVLSQMVLELIVNPRKKYLSISEKIIYTMTMYACFYSNPYNLTNENNVRGIEKYNEGSKEMRKIGAELAGYLGTVPKIRKNKRKRLKKVLDSIIGLSNGFFIISEDYNIIKENKKLEKIINEELHIK